MIVIIDNYDSYVYNLAQAFGKHCDHIAIFKNDEIRLADLKRMPIELLIISPGPGRPEDALLSLECIEYFAGIVPIFGVCLGLQCLGIYYGGKLDYAIKPMHGKKSIIQHDCDNIFKNIPNNIAVVRYNSLIIKDEGLDSKKVKVTARSNFNEIMALRCADLCIDAVQFHPESFDTEYGDILISNVYKQSCDFWELKINIKKEE